VILTGFVTPGFTQVKDFSPNGWKAGKPEGFETAKLSSDGFGTGAEG
jgi:hypothetical protein